MFSNLLLPKASKLVLTIYQGHRSQTPTLKVLSIIIRPYPPSYVDLKPRLVNPKLPLLPNKSTTSNRVWVEFWRLLVPSCCYFELKESSSIYALRFILEVFLVARKEKRIGETSTMSTSINGCNSLLHLLIHKALSFPILVSC